MPDSLPKRIPNDTFRDRYQYLERTEFLTFAELAFRVGWVTVCSRTGKEKPDSSRVGRMLGLVEESVQGVKKLRTHVSQKNALILCEGLHIDPWEVGL